MMDSEMEVVTSEMFHFSNLFTAVRNDKESHLSKYLFRLFCPLQQNIGHKYGQKCPKL